MKKSILYLVIFILFSSSCYSQGYLGVTYGNLTQENKKKYNSIPFSEVHEVEKNSPAFNAGIQKGDILLSINNKEILQGKSILSSLLMDFNPEQEVKLELLRNNQKISLKATLTEWPKEKLEIAKNLLKKQKEIDLEYEWLKTHNYQNDIKLFITHINKVLELNPDDYQLRTNRTLLIYADLNIYEAYNDADILLTKYKSNLNNQILKSLYFLKINSELAKKRSAFGKLNYAKEKTLFDTYFNLLDKNDIILKQKIKNYLTKPTICGVCNGTGKMNWDYNCENCSDWNNEYRRKVACHICKDTRKVKGKKQCIMCNKGIEDKYQLIYELIREEFKKETNIMSTPIY